MQEIAVRVRTEALDRHEPMRRLGADMYPCLHCKRQFAATDIRHSVVVDWETVDMPGQMCRTGGLVARLCSNRCAWWYSQHYRSMKLARVTWRVPSGMDRARHIVWRVKDVHVTCVRIEGGRLYDVFPPPR